MSDALKRIEEGHRTQSGCEAGCSCDTLKLARALDAMIRELWQECNHHVDVECVRCRAERTLEEVAGA